jgi:uncharacterized protein YrrD
MRARRRVAAPTRLDLVSAAMSDNQPIAWLALEKGTPVVASDGEELGKVSEVVADEQKDIFSGVTIRQGLLGDDKFIPASMIETLTEGAVHLNVPAEDARESMEHYEG